MLVLARHVPGKVDGKELNQYESQERLANRAQATLRLPTFTRNEDTIGQRPHVLITMARLSSDATPAQNSHLTSHLLRMSKYLLEEVWQLSPLPVV